MIVLDKNVKIEGIGYYIKLKYFDENYYQLEIIQDITKGILLFTIRWYYLDHLENNNKEWIIYSGDEDKAIPLNLGFNQDNLNLGLYYDYYYKDPMIENIILMVFGYVLGFKEAL